MLANLLALTSWPLLGHKMDMDISRQSQARKTTWALIGALDSHSFSY